MKTLNTLLILTLLLLACSKDESPKPNNNESIYTSCKVLSSSNYNGAGEIIGSSQYYYTGQKLDSTVSFDPSGNIIYTFVYEYINENERVSYTFVNNEKQAGRGWQKIDSYGNIIESKTYDHTNALIYHSRINFDCN